MDEHRNHVHIINDSIRNIFKSASSIPLKDHLTGLFSLKNRYVARKAAKVRQKWKEWGYGPNSALKTHPWKVWRFYAKRATIEKNVREILYATILWERFLQRIG